MAATELLIGAAIGVGAMVAKEKYMDSKTNSSIEIQLNELSDENEKLRRRNKEAERQIEDLLAENEKLRRKAKDVDDNFEDLQDELETTKREINKMQMKNDELSRMVQEYKAVCANYEDQINKINKP